MGYGISYFMRKDYQGWDTHEGQARFTQELAETLKKIGIAGPDALVEIEEGWYMVYLHEDNSYATELTVHGNMIEAWTPYSWSVLLLEDAGADMRKEFLDIAEAIGADDCCIGTDKATEQASFIWPENYEGWLEAARHHYGKIDEFDRESLARDLADKKWPIDVYHESFTDIKAMIEQIKMNASCRFDRVSQVREICDPYYILDTEAGKYIWDSSSRRTVIDSPIVDYRPMWYAGHIVTTEDGDLFYSLDWQKIFMAGPRASIEVREAVRLPNNAFAACPTK